MASKSKSNALWIVGGVAVALYLVGRALGEGIKNVFESPEMISKARLAFQSASPDTIAFMKRNYEAASPQQRAIDDATLAKLGLKRPW